MKPQQIVNEQERYALRVAPDSLVAAGARLKIAMRNFLKLAKAVNPTSRPTRSLTK